LLILANEPGGWAVARFRGWNAGDEVVKDRRAHGDSVAGHWIFGKWIEKIQEMGHNIQLDH
jgi:hypothetical protein